MNSSRNSRLSFGSHPGDSSPLSIPRAPSVLRQSTRPAQPPPPVHDTEKDELRVQCSTFKYELENIKQERDLMVLRHEKELRDLQSKRDADFRKAQAADTSSHRANHKYETLAKEMKEIQEQALNDKASLERKIRTLQDQNQSLQEDVEDNQAQSLDHERQYKYQLNELETIRSSLQKTVEELQNDLQNVRNELQSTQERLRERDVEFVNLETENIRLKAEGSDAETLAVLKRELSEQVNHIRNLETTNRDQTAELRQLRKSHKNVEVVEEQKKSLENQLQLMKGLESELGTVQIQKQLLEDERNSWASLLQDSDQSEEFTSPEDVAKALLRERLEKASLVDRVGSIEAQFLEKDETIKGLETERSNLRHELEKLRNAGAGLGGAMADTRVKARLERQRTLAVKEVEYLRAQLKTFDAEEVTMNEQSQFDEQKSEQIANLEKLIDQYRKELEQAHEELFKRESVPQEDAQPRGVKRPLSPAESEVENERVSALSRKNRTLQESLSKSEQAAALLRKEFEAAKSQLKSLKAKSRTRVLELRDNPTAEAEKIKLSTLATFKAENQDLLAQLRGSQGGADVVPASTLESMKLDIQDMERTVADKEKRMRRLKEIWTAKSSEFREAVASLLGYKLDFLPNGRVRVTSMFHLSPAYRHGDGASADSAGPGSMGNGEENSIIFDGENGTMKISGGPNSLFAMEIKPIIKFWVEERKDIPCFLAAMTLDFFEKTTRALRT